MKLTAKVNSIDIKHEDATLAWITFDDDNISIDADLTLEELEELVEAIKEAYAKYTGILNEKEKNKKED